MVEQIIGTDVSGFKGQYKTALETNFPDKVTIQFGDKKIEYTGVDFALRYGTNPHQPYGMFKPVGDSDLSIGELNLLKGGKAGLSLTNVQDMSQALNILKYFSDPACAAMKHLNPCGFKVKTKEGEQLYQLYESARDCDDRSAFGSVVGFNTAVDKPTAEAIMSSFVECVIAPSYKEGVMDIFRKTEGTKKLNNAIRIGEFKNLNKIPKYDGDDIKGYLSIKSMADGSIAFELPYLTQIRNINDFIVDPMVPADPNKEGDQTSVIGRLPTPQELTDGLSAWYLNINTRSNGIVFVKDGRGITVGTGQQERVGAVEQAIAKAKQKGHSLEGAVMSSDAFFPNRDSIDAIGAEGVKAVVWPAGSLADKVIIDAANEYGIALMCSKGERCFAHF